MFTLLGYFDVVAIGDDAGDPLFVDPISVRCTRCGHSAVLFDEGDGDGYNAVIGARKKRATSPGEPRIWRLNGSEEYKVKVDVSYDDDSFDSLKEGELYDDAFSSIAISTRDKSGKGHSVTWFETM